MSPVPQNIIVGSNGSHPSWLMRLKQLVLHSSLRVQLIALAGIVVIGGGSWAAVHFLRPTDTNTPQQTTTQTSGSSKTETTKPEQKTTPQTTTPTPAKTTPTSPTSSGVTPTNSSGSNGGGTGNQSNNNSTPPFTCPALPAFPDENCTGYAHTGVTLHACSTPLTQPTYDSCLFTGEVNVSASNITVTRSKIVGYVDFRTVDDGSLRGLTLTDVEIDSTNYQGGATIGNNDYTCIRCNIHGGTRGFNVGYNVTIKDSYSHGWHSQPSDHITGIGSNGGAHNTIDHNNISCDILNDSTGYACSSGLSVYGDDPPGNDDWTITNNLINSGSSYCMVIAGPPSKPYPFTNMRVTGNHFGNMGAHARGLPDSQCTEYGPISTNSSSWGVNGNVWSGNVDSNGGAVNL